MKRGGGVPNDIGHTSRSGHNDVGIPTCFWRIGSNTAVSVKPISRNTSNSLAHTRVHTWG